MNKQRAAGEFSFDDAEVARCPGQSYQDILSSDAGLQPEILKDESFIHQGHEDLSVDRYLSQEFHDLEKERLWPRVWQMVCREEHIPEVGDHILYEINDDSFIIIRTAPDEIKAYYNVCLHRGTQLRSCDGNVKQLRCPFHGFAWNLDGTLKDIPCRWDFGQVKDSELKLDEAHVDLWAGFVFINQSENPQPLLEYIYPAGEHFENWPMHDRHISAHVGKVMNCNWKMAQEAFMEVYHVVSSHPQVLPYVGDCNSQYDIWEDAPHVSRMLTAQMVPSPHLGDTVSEQEMLDAMQADMDLPGFETITEIPEGVSARQHFADKLREYFTEITASDCSHLSNAELLDAIEYFIFPNFHPWGGVTLPMVYRFRPWNNDPGKCLMEVILLRPNPVDEPAPPPAKLHMLSDDEDWGSASELGWLGLVFDQDVVNVARMQTGLKTTKRSGVVMSIYQESRIRHMHRTLSNYLSKP